MSPYYINRSVVAGQLQFVLFPRNMAMIIAVLPGALSTASLVQHPSFCLAKDRLTKTDAPMRAAYSSWAVNLTQTI